MLSTNSTALYFHRFSWVSGYFSSAGIAAVSILARCSMDIRNRELDIFIYSVILWRIVWTRVTFYGRQSSCLYDFKKKKNLREKIRKKQTKNIAIVDAVLFVRKQISRARGSIQVAADFIWEFYKWLYVIARIHVRYVTDIIVSQIAA